MKSPSYRLSTKTQCDNPSWAHEAGQPTVQKGLILNLVLFINVGETAQRQARPGGLGFNRSPWSQGHNRVGYFIRTFLFLDICLFK